MSLEERIFSLETEYAINFYPVDAGSKPEAKTIVQALHEVLAKDYGIMGSFYLVTGAKFHHDVGHAEWAQPECRTAREAATYDKAADHLLARVLPNAQQILNEKGYQGQLLIAKNNVDFLGNTYGCHENYLMLRDTELLTGEHFLRYLARCLIPFLVTRQLFTGAGRLVPASLSPSRQPTYEISQRTAFIDTVISKETTKDRPIFNIGREGEALASGNYRRLHMILGDANLSGWATWMKLGTTGIVLRMIEDMFIIDMPILHDPLEALRTISRDVTCRVPLAMRDGKRMSALDIQWFYYERVNTYLAEFGCSDEEDDLMDAWEEVLKDITHEPMKLRNRVDWAMKKRFLDTYLAQSGSSWENIARDQPIISSLQAYDLRFHDISREGLFNRFSYPDTLVTEAEIQTAQQIPPPYTRARMRGEVVLLARQYNIRVTIENWQEVHLDGEKINLPDPLEFDHPELSSSGMALARRLEKACEQNPNDVQKHYLLSRMYKREELYRRAVRPAFRAVKLQPEDFYNVENLAHALLIQGSYEEAIHWYKKANQLIEDKKLLRYNGIGLAYYFLGRYKEAMNAFRKQIDISPESEDALFAYANLGVAFLKIGQITSAEKQFQKAFERNNHHLLSLVALGLIHLSHGDRSQAYPMLESAVSLPQDSYRGHTKGTASYYRAIAHIALGHEEGLILLREALKRRDPVTAEGVSLINPLMGLLVRAPEPSPLIQQTRNLILQAEEIVLQAEPTGVNLDNLVFEKEREWLREIVTHKDVHIRARAAKYLVWRKSSEALTFLQEMAQRDESERVRLAAVQALGTVASDTATNILLSCLSDSIPAVRWAAQEALEKMGREGSIQPATTVSSSDSDDGESLIQLIS